MVTQNGKKLKCHSALVVYGAGKEGEAMEPGPRKMMLGSLWAPPRLAVIGKNKKYN